MTSLTKKCILLALWKSSEPHGYYGKVISEKRHKSKLFFIADGKQKLKKRKKELLGGNERK